MQFESQQVETQGDPVFQFESEGSKSPVSQPQGRQAGRQAVLPRTQPFFFPLQSFNGLDEATHRREDNLLQSNDSNVDLT